MYGSISLYISEYDDICRQIKMVNDMVNGEVKTRKKTTMVLEDVKVNVKIIITALWVAHFLLWTFGDMVSLLQQLNGPVAHELLLFASVPLAFIQVGMILFSLIGKAKMIRWVNFCIIPVFVLLNIGFMTEAKFGWEFLLGLGYIAVNILILIYAWKWPKVSNKKSGGI
jgi:hypothetical protein